MAKKNQRKARPIKRDSRKMPGKSGRGSSRMSGRKPKSAVAKSKGRGGGGGGGEAARSLELLNWTHELTAKMLGSIPADRLTFQTSPADNHALWTTGHFATAYSWFASLLDGKPASLPEPYEKLFGYKSTPTADASGYPPIDDVRSVHESAYKRLCAAIGAISDADAHKPTPTDSGGFAKSRLDVAYKATWHEGWHQGQISTLRRAMGLPPMM